MFAIAATAACAVRKEPSHKSEMVSELLLGEGVSIIEEGDSFCKIICAHDNYEGWCASNQLALVTELPVTTLFSKNDIDAVVLNNQPCKIGFGTPIYQQLQAQQCMIDYTGVATLQAVAKAFTTSTIEDIVFPYINTPYVWGGRSIFGIDCSGFIQQVFRMLQVSLPRDAHEQATFGEVVAFVEAAAAGDVAFFENEENKIIHVGLIIGSHKIMHAHGSVRIDKLDQQGIINTTTGKRTHRLRVIKRML